MSEQTIKVAIVEDDREILQSLVAIIDGSPGFVCRQYYSSCEAALDALCSAPPNLVLMDIGLPGMSGIEGVRRLKERQPTLDCVMLTIQDDDDSVFQSICAGATGYLMKNTPPSQLLQAIEDVYKGGSSISAAIARKVIGSFQQTAPSPLSTREAEILGLLCDGDNYRMIAEKLFVSGNTVRAHIKNIYKKLHVNSRAQAVRVALRDRLV